MKNEHPTSNKKRKAIEQSTAKSSKRQKNTPHKSNKRMKALADYIKSFFNTTGSITEQEPTTPIASPVQTDNVIDVLSSDDEDEQENTPSKNP